MKRLGMTRLPSVMPIIALTVAVACAPPGAPGSGQKPSGPIKVGLLAPTTGVSAASGNDMLNGWNLYFKLNGNTVAGREVETTHEDTVGDPNTALTKTRQYDE